MSNYYQHLTTDELLAAAKAALRRAPVPTGQGGTLNTRPYSSALSPSSAEQGPNIHAQKHERERQERRLRSLQTCHRHTHAEKPREPKPAPSRAYVPELSAALDNDPNLTDGARRLGRKLAEVIYRQNREGRFTEITVNYLMKALTRSRRTIQRYLRALEQGGYIYSEVIRGDRSRLCTGLLITLCRSLFAAHHQKNWPASRKSGAPQESQNKRLIDSNRKKERLSIRQWSSLCMDGVFRSLMKTDPLASLPLPAT